jgi:hypothetical protein
MEARITKEIGRITKRIGLSFLPGFNLLVGGGGADVIAQSSKQKRDYPKCSGNQRERQDQGGSGAKVVTG